MLTCDSMISSPRCLKSSRNASPLQFKIVVINIYAMLRVPCTSRSVVNGYKYLYHAQSNHTSKRHELNTDILNHQLWELQESVV